MDRDIEKLYNAVNACLNGLTARLGLGEGGIYLDYKPRAIHYDGRRALNGFKSDIRKIFKDYIKEQKSSIEKQ